MIAMPKVAIKPFAAEIENSLPRRLVARMVPEERIQVFRPSFRRFYRAEAARPTAGHGLGLSLVAVISDVHGALVTIAEAAGGGRGVTLRFPPIGVDP